MSTLSGSPLYTPQPASDDPVLYMYLNYRLGMFGTCMWMPYTTSLEVITSSSGVCLIVKG